MIESRPKIYRTSDQLTMQMQPPFSLLRRLFFKPNVTLPIKFEDQQNLIPSSSKFVDDDRKLISLKTFWNLNFSWN